MTIGLTARAAELLAHGIAPTYAEMMAAVGQKSKAGVHRLISLLEERGQLRRIPNRARAIELTSPTRHICPNCGHVIVPAIIETKAA